MSRARLGYDFLALPRKRHPGWIGLKHSSGQFLFAPLFEIAEGAPISIHGSDWRVWLCRIWCLSGKARSPVCKALDELAERGVIAVGEGFLSVLFRPDDEHKEGAQRPKPSPRKEHSGSEQEHVSPNSGRRLGLSAENDSTPKIQTDRQKREKEERERAGAREGSDFRKPLPEEPPNLPPREQPLGEWIATEHSKRHVARTGTTPGGSDRYSRAREVAAWVDANCEAYKLTNRALATKLLDGLFASDRAGAKGWGLGWLQTSPQEFCGLPPGVKPVVAEPKSAEPKNPTHQVWKAPDYAAEQRESEERYLREREEWFAQHPELRAEVESDPLEITPRVVVSIAEAKAPAKAYRPKSPEELAARRAALEEQARAIRAAANAGE